MEQKQTRVLNMRVLQLNIPHYGNLRRDCRKLLHFTCVNLNCPEIFFHIVIVETTHFRTVLVLVPYRTYQDEAFFSVFIGAWKGNFSTAGRNPSKCLKNLKLPIFR